MLADTEHTLRIAGNATARLYHLKSRRGAVDAFETPVGWNGGTVFEQSFFDRYGDDLMLIEEPDNRRSLFHLRTGNFVQVGTEPLDKDLLSVLKRHPEMAEPLAPYVAPAMRGALAEKAHTRHDEDMRLLAVANLLFISKELGVWQNKQTIPAKLINAAFDQAYNEYWPDEGKPHPLSIIMASCAEHPERKHLVAGRMAHAATQMYEGLSQHTFALMLQNAATIPAYQKAIPDFMPTAALTVARGEKTFSDMRWADTISTRVFCAAAARKSDLPEFLVERHFDAFNKDSGLWNVAESIAATKGRPEWQAYIPPAMTKAALLYGAGTSVRGSELLAGVFDIGEENSAVEATIVETIGEAFVKAAKSITGNSQHAENMTLIMDRAKKSPGRLKKVAAAMPAALTALKDEYSCLHKYGALDRMCAKNMQVIMQGAANSPELKLAVQQALPDLMDLAVENFWRDTLRAVLTAGREQGNLPYGFTIRNAIPDIYEGLTGQQTHSLSGSIAKDMLADLEAEADSFAPYRAGLDQAKTPPGFMGMFRGLGGLKGGGAHPS